MKTFRIKSIKNLRVASLIVFVLSCLIVPYRVKWNYKGANANATVGYHLLIVEPSPGEAMKQIEDISPDDLLGGFYESNKFDRERQQLHPFTTDLRYKYWYKKSSDAL
ncbi:MAG TPA: hypothetical protein VFX22_00120, partial [Candidatus Kapabacteria bacterium]|nr:hypothetical protein [Candidatus Kapabacteria bacterium]